MENVSVDYNNYGDQMHSNKFLKSSFFVFPRSNKSRFMGYGEQRRSSPPSQISSLSLSLGIVLVVDFYSWRKLAHICMCKGTVLLYEL